MQKIMDFTKRYIGVISIVLALCILLTYTLSSFIVTNGNHRAAEMYIGQLKYTLTLDGNNTNTIEVAPGTTMVDVNITNLNAINTYYKLLYENNENIEIYYFEQLNNDDGTVGNYNPANSSLKIDATSKIKLKIVNNYSEYQSVTLKVSGGYGTNTLDDVEVPDGYSEIPKGIEKDPKAKYCYTDQTLNVGTKYENGIYTYSYKTNSGGGLAWEFFEDDEDGWGVVLTDKTSTNSVSEVPCTFVNDKPVLSMSYMFMNSKAESFDLSNFYTKYVTRMASMFASSAATTLDVSNLDTSNAKTLSGMFSKSSATEIKGLNNFDTSNAVNISYMFSGSQVTSLPEIENFDTSNVTNMAYMFSGSHVSSLDLSKWDISNVTNMGSMFMNEYTRSLKIDNFNTGNVTNMSYMFATCNIQDLDLSNFNTSNVTNMAGMFANSLITSIDISSFDTSNVTDMHQMFMAGSLTTVKGLDRLNTSKVIDMSSMFFGSKLSTINVSNFDTSNVTNMYSMFFTIKATTLTGLTNFDTSNVTNMQSMFGNNSFTSYDLSSFDTAKVTNMKSMFENCHKLKTIYVSNKFITDNVTDSKDMFSSSSSLVGGNGTKYTSSYKDKTYARIDKSGTPGYFTLKSS